jgi:hypothetical protein
MKSVDVKSLWSNQSVYLFVCNKKLECLEKFQFFSLKNVGFSFPKKLDYNLGRVITTASLTNLHNKRDSKARTTLNAFTVNFGLKSKQKIAS